MLTLGCHLSIANGFEAIGKEAVSIGANTFAFFTRNPRGGKARDLDPEDVAALRDILDAHEFGPLVAHAPYTLNAASKAAHTREFAHLAFKDDLERLEHLPGNYYNFHPGSHVGQGVDKGVDFIVKMLNEILWEDMQTTVLLETMSGKGTEIGRTFEELQMILKRVQLRDKIGVCLDTCHVHEGGYDIVDNLEAVLDEFDKIVGLEHLKALHLNDSKNPRGAHKDRHEKLGKGEIGIAVFESIVNHDYLKTLPMVLETPQEEVTGWGEEIELLRSLKR